MSEMNHNAGIIERLKRDRKALEDAAHTERCDCRDPETMKRKAEELDELFRCRSAFQDHRKNDSDREYLCLKRRKQAILQLCPEVQERFGEKYPMLSAPDALMQLSAPSAQLTFDDLNREYAIELAAAIRILDTLKESDAYEKAKQFFPQSRGERDTVSLPYLSDSVHSDDELRSMIYVIRNRNRGMSGFRADVAFCDEADIGRIKGDDVPQDRERFNAVMALLDPDEIKALQDEFAALLWEHFDRLLCALNARIGVREKKREALSDALAVHIAALEQMQSQAAAPLLLNGGQDALKDFFTADPVMTTTGTSLELQARELERLTDELQREDAAVDAMYCLLNMLPAWVDGRLQDDGQTDVYADLPLPVIRNPYDICFAFLTLLDENSDLIWLWNLSLNIVAFACMALPWADTDAMAPDGEDGEIRIDYAYLKTLIEKHPDWDENSNGDQLYERRIPSLLQKNRRVFTSIAGLACFSSGLIPPRTSRPISFMRALLRETDYSPEVQELLYHYFALAYSLGRQADDDQIPDDARDGEEPSEEKADAEGRDAEIKKLRAQIKHLKNAVNQTEHRNKALSSELSAARRQLDAANAELAELRSMIRESSDADNESPTLVAFPYTARKRTVIIGGHDSWLKAIKPLLNNVRYIGPSEQPNAGVILNSETVWIQSNALGHSSFYKIIDLIRKNDIKVCYFKYASAEKCAEQLALEDSEAESDT